MLTASYLTQGLRFNLLNILVALVWGGGRGIAHVKDNKHSVLVLGVLGG